MREISGLLYPGPEYVAAIEAFAKQSWEPHRAGTRSPSLKRAIVSLERLNLVSL